MLLTVEAFRERVATELPKLIEELKLLTGRGGSKESDAWRASLPKLADALASPALAPMHLYFAGAGLLTLEYKLPAASAWCDVVLLGDNRTQPHAVIIELKDWQTWGDRPGPYEGLIVHRGVIEHHPSDQVRGYVEYCRRFHSSVQEHGADVSGLVFFTRDYFPGPYASPPNEQLVIDYPCFSSAPDVLREALPRYLTQHITAPNKSFALDFVRGSYRQNRGFVRQVGEQILSPESGPFELLDHQRRAFALTRAHIEDAIFGDTTPKKRVIIIEGPPGSGKSVLAAKLWAALVSDERLPEGNAVLTTTSVSQSSNWTRLFQRASGSAGAAGIVKKATSYVPVTTQAIPRLRERFGNELLRDHSAWRQSVELLRDLGVSFQTGAQDDMYLVSIVDEAHALINPEHPEGRGQFGFAPNLGPLGWHIIRASKVTIFLMDEEQGFRDRENTSAVELRQWASELGATVSEPISLQGAQFRCGGSTEFVDWVEIVLAGEAIQEARALARVWQGLIDFRIFKTPLELERALRERIGEGRSARLVASFARPWKTKGATNPHRLPGQNQDFHIPYEYAGRETHWSRIWNYVPKGSDYTWFIQGPQGSHIHDDPLCEVGCPYAVRGFDFDYVGMLWLSDLKRRDGQWVVDFEHVHETGVISTLKRAKEEPAEGTHRAILRNALNQAYRILLTRGIYGVYLWFEDQETREFVESCLDQGSEDRG